MSTAMNIAEGASRMQLLDLINASWTTQAIRTACVLRVPELLAAGASDADALASAGCDAPSMRRLVRALATLGVCSEGERPLR
jgi:hypothetical protein